MAAIFEKISVRRAAGYSNEGTLRASREGFEWSAGAETVSIGRGDLASLTWTPLHLGFQLAVAKSDGSLVNFTGKGSFLCFHSRRVSAGLRHEAYDKLKELEVGELLKEELSTKGHNWGKLQVNGKTAVFMAHDAKPIFKIPLPEVSTVQYGKDDVTFEFGGATEVPDGEDVLVGMSFHVPTENEDFPPPDVDMQEEEVPELRDPDATKKKELPAKRFFKLVSPHIDAAGKSEQPVRNAPPSRARRFSLGWCRLEHSRK